MTTASNCITNYLCSRQYGTSTLTAPPDRRAARTLPRRPEAARNLDGLQRRAARRVQATRRRPARSLIFETDGQPDEVGSAVGSTACTSTSDVWSGRADLRHGDGHERLRTASSRWPTSAKAHGHHRHHDRLRRVPRPHGARSPVASGRRPAPSKQRCATSSRPLPPPARHRRGRARPRLLHGSTRGSLPRTWTATTSSARPTAPTWPTSSRTAINQVSEGIRLIRLPYDPPSAHCTRRRAGPGGVCTLGGRVLNMRLALSSRE